jgi:hypothetical protein
MTDLVYRGGDFVTGFRRELQDGRLRSSPVSVYSGLLEMGDVNQTVPKTTPLDELPWSERGGGPKPYTEDTYPVIGGISRSITTAVGFSRGLPMLAYLDRASLPPELSEVAYDLRYFNSTPGALAWVVGDLIDSEIRDVERGLVGLSLDAEYGPAVWEWGQSDLRYAARLYSEERELIALTESMDIRPAIKGIALMLEGRLTAKGVLDSERSLLYGNSGAGPASLARVPQLEVLDTLYSAIERLTTIPIPEMWIVSLTRGGLPKGESSIPTDAFEYAYDGSQQYRDPDAIPQYLLGGE